MRCVCNYVENRHAKQSQTAFIYTWHDAKWIINSVFLSISCCLWLSWSKWIMCTYRLAVHSSQPFVVLFFFPSLHSFSSVIDALKFIWWPSPAERDTCITVVVDGDEDDDDDDGTEDNMCGNNPEWLALFFYSSKIRLSYSINPLSISTVGQHNQLQSHSNST